MPILRVVSGALEDGMRRGSVYGDDLFVFEKAPPMEEFCVFTDALIREAFETGDPVMAQFGLGQDEYLSRVEALQKGCRRDGTARELFLAALGRVGVDLRRTFGDWLYLRVSPHGEEYSGHRTAKLVFQRVSADQLVGSDLSLEPGPHDGLLRRVLGETPQEHERRVGPGGDQGRQVECTLGARTY